MSETSEFACVACVNSREILDQNLMRSPDVQSGGLKVIELWDAASAAGAFAAVQQRPLARNVIFLHQDIYLPRGWLHLLRQAIATVETFDREWGVIGVYGATDNGTHVGYVYDCSTRRTLGKPVDEPQKVRVFDEIVLIVRSESGVAFDPALPGFHMYGTDLALTAHSRHKSTWVAHLPVVHNSRTIKTLDADFYRAWMFVSRKWRAVLPVPNLMCVALDGTGWPVWKWRLRSRVNAFRYGRPMYQRLADPVPAARSAGLE